MRKRHRARRRPVAVFGRCAVGVLIAQMTLLSATVPANAINPPSRRALAGRLGTTRGYAPTARDVALKIKPESTNLTSQKDSASASHE